MTTTPPPSVTPPSAYRALYDWIAVPMAAVFSWLAGADAYLRGTLPFGAPLVGSKAGWTINDVRSRELDYVVKRRRRVNQSADDGHGRLMAAHSLVGIALSGGGIRSATTNLGILQALSRMGILPVVDYISTVSGGGYIGSCLAALLSVRPPAVGPPPNSTSRFAFSERRQLWFTARWPNFPFNPDRVRWGGPIGGPLGRRVVSHLRTHGTFLIARRGLFRRDALRSVGHLITGTVYHVTMLLLTLLTLTVLSLWAAHGMTDRLGATLKEIELAPTEDSSRTELRVGNNAAPVFVLQGTNVAQPLDRLVGGFIKVYQDLLTHWANPAVLAAAGAGGVTTVTMLIFFGWGVRRSEWPRTPSAGLSIEDALENGLLKVAAAMLIVAATLAAVVASRVRSGTGTAFLIVPAAVFAGANAAGFVFYVLLSWDILGVWDRCFRSLWGAYQTLTAYGLFAALIFGCLPVAAYAAADGASPWVLVAPVVSLVLARVVAGGTFGEKSRLKLPRALLHFLLGLFAVIVTTFLAVSFGGLVLNATSDFEVSRPGFNAILVLTVAFLVFANINKVGPHYFYRDRLLETYLRSEYIAPSQAMEPLTDSMTMCLKELHGLPASGSPAETEAGNTSPYLLISAAINLAGSRDLTRKDRKSGYFLFSKYFCGSTHTGFEQTGHYRGGATNLGRAITISGAAASTGMGQNTFFAQSFFMALFNLRLGYWMANPARRGVWDGLAFWPVYLVREMFGLTHERTRLVNLSDGGHTGDNVGIYPLLQRRCQVIIACDAEQDSKLAFGSFTEALRHAYIDLNVDVDIDLDMIRPDPQTGYSRSHCVVGRVRYRECPDRPNWLIYLKSSLTGDEPAPVMNYKQMSRDFPHETTADQFFDDAQFESYRALGVHIAEDAFAAWTSDPEVAMLLSARSPFRGADVADNELVARWQEVLQWLMLQHMSFHPSDTEDFKELTRQFSALERLFLEDERLRGYYNGCMEVDCGPFEPPDPCVTIHAAAMQIQLMEDAFFSLRLYHYANAPDNRGWMNLFRSWSRYELFRRHFGELSAYFSKQFVRFYEDYIEDWKSIDTHPVPHAWDLAERPPDYEMPRREDLLPEERERLARDRDRTRTEITISNYSGDTARAVRTIEKVQAFRQRAIKGVWLDRGRREAGAPHGEPPGDEGATTPPADRSHGEKGTEPWNEPS